MKTSFEMFHQRINNDDLDVPVYIDCEKVVAISQKVNSRGEFIDEVYIWVEGRETPFVVIGVAEVVLDTVKFL